jgi:gliding motility-associated-like protein
LSNRKFEVEYILGVFNMGGNDLVELHLIDSLDKTFKNGAVIVGKPNVKVFLDNSTTSMTEWVDTAFTGKNGHYDLLVAELTNLAAKKTLTVQLKIIVDASNSTDTVFYNTAYATGLDVNGNVCSDESDDAKVPDSNGNGDSSDDSTPTPVRVNGFGGSADTDIFIPEGFSPNADGINDAFVIRKPNSITALVEIYNRLGGLVYRSEDYKNDWAGVSTANADVPVGTYFYVIKLSDGREFSRFMTISR